jgi:hypothetical protein
VHALAWGAALPDPTSGGGFMLAGTGIAPNSPQFQAAQQTCAKVVLGYGI